MDIRLLKKLVETQSSVSDDNDINSLIKDIIKQIPGVEISEDTYGNIYAVKGEGKNGYKTIVSHTDTVHKIKLNRKAFIYENVLFTMELGLDTIYKTETVRMTGTGGDDRAGIYTCIKALQDFDDVKAVFFRFEETGCNGSRESDISFFDDSNFILQCDRMGNSDFITYTNGMQVASKEFEKKAEKIYKHYGYKSARGVSTDIGALKRNGVSVSCANISAGYISPHSDYETINLTDLDSCYNLVKHLFKDLGETRFEHEYKPIVYKDKKYSKSDNFFTKKKVFDEEQNILGAKKQPAMFQRIGIAKIYQPTRDVFIWIGKQKDKEDNIEYMFFSRNGEVTYFKHNEELTYKGKDLYKFVKTEDNGFIFVYNRLYDYWLKEEDAIYDEELNSYIEKE